MMALTGILLSSAILGANTSVAQAASNNAINVNKSGFNNAIQVINDLLNSSLTANKVNSQTQFSDMANESDMNVEPIFGEQSSSSFNETLQSELNVVDSSSQLVPMKVVTPDDHGFTDKVSYTLNGVTKIVNVHYNYAMPTLTFGAGANAQYLNVKAGNTDAIDAAAISTNGLKVNTTNKTDANGTSNATSIDVDKNNYSSANATSTVQFTPRDSYARGIFANRTVNVYQEPNWDNVNKQMTFQSGDNVTNQQQVYIQDNHRYLITMSNYDKENNTVDYSATAIDSKGNTINDSLNSKAITYTTTGRTIEPNTSDATPSYTIIFKDGDNTIGTSINKADGISDDGIITISPETVEAAATKVGVTLKSTPTAKTIDASTTTNNLSQTYSASTTADTTVNYFSTVTGKSLNAPEELKGANGDPKILSIPTGYKLANVSDLVQTLNADQPTKDVYVTPIKTTVGNLSYTVTFRDKDTGKVVGSEVKSEGNLGDYIGLTAPDGYAFSTILDHGFVLLKNNQSVTKYVTAADTPYSISYVDQDTGKEVGTQSGKGADGSDVTLKSPDNYAFVSADDMTYTIDKSDTATKTVYVKKSNQTVDNIVAGYPQNGYIKIYDANGKLNNDVVLTEGSSWIVDKTQTIKGSEYYRVATNEYVKASDVYKYTPLQSIVTTRGTNVTPVYNSRGQLLANVALDTNTPWYTDRSAEIRGSLMYRVSTDGWVKASDVDLTK